MLDKAEYILGIHSQEDSNQSDKNAAFTVQDGKFRHLPFRVIPDPPNAGDHATDATNTTADGASQDTRHRDFGPVLVLSVIFGTLTLIFLTFCVRRGLEEREKQRRVARGEEDGIEMGDWHARRTVKGPRTDDVIWL